MAAWLISLEGTEAGRHLAMGLALLAAVLHALFGALQKGRFDPWVTRGAMDAHYALIAAPVALFVVPWPEAHMWPIFAGAVVVHTVYKVLQAKAYMRGAYTVVYPVVRGTGPLFTVLGAGVIFAETYAPAQWAGVLLLSGGILGLAAFNLRYLSVGRETLLPALGFALATGVMVAVYTSYDAWGIRATANPFTFLAWFFFLDGILLPLALHRRILAVPRADWPALARLGFGGSIVAFFSFGAVMLATRLDKVGEAAVLRETSVVFAALIGWALLGEKVGPARAALMTLIAAGAVVMEFGG